MSTTTRTPPARVSVLRALSIVLAFMTVAEVTCKTTSQTEVGDEVDRNTIADGLRVAHRVLLAIATAVGSRPSSALARGSPTRATHTDLGSKPAMAAAQSLPVVDRSLRQQHTLVTNPIRKKATTGDRTSPQTA